MKKIASFMSRSFPTMEQQVIPSSTLLGTANKNPMKRTVIRKNRHKKHARIRKDLILNKVVSYLISDSYMYNPLVSVSGQPAFDFPPPEQICSSPGIQEDVALPVEGRNKKLVEKVVDFLEADCYFYSSLIVDDDHVGPKSYAANKSSGGQMQKGTVEEGGDLSRPLGARPVVKKTVAYRETVKHTVHSKLE